MDILEGESRRTQNFSDREICLLKDLVKLNRDKLENKKSDAITWKEKARAWESLDEEFNKRNIGNYPRTAKNLKNKWENLKKITRKKFAAERQQLFKTGGGPSVPIKVTEIDNDIKEILGATCTGLENEFDSQNIEIICIENQSGNESEPDNETKPDHENKMWESWTPAKLKNPLSKELTVKDKQEDEPSLLKVTDNTNPESQGISKIPTVNNPRYDKKRRASELTQDCRVKMNVLAEARLELVHTQKQSVIEEMKIRADQYNLAKELHALEVMKRKLEIELLKKKLEI